MIYGPDALREPRFLSHRLATARPQDAAIPITSVVNGRQGSYSRDPIPVRADQGENSVRYEKKPLEVDEMFIMVNHSLLTTRSLDFPSSGPLMYLHLIKTRKTNLILTQINARNRQRL